MTAPLICGIDEVGRGCLAGPIIAVAALFRGYDTGCPSVDDSKKLSPSKRHSIFKQLRWSPFLVGFGVGEVSAEEIEIVGINQANEDVFVRSVENLPKKPDFVIVDGVNGLKNWEPAHMRVEPKADAKYPVVGAASIIAKVIRDDYMVELSQKYPGYDWHSNKGYGTKKHIEGIKKLGPTPFHRPYFIRNLK